MFGIMLIKGIASLAVIGGSIGMGIIKGNELNDRVEDVRELQRILNMLENEIEYKQNNLLTALEDIKERTNNERFKQLLKLILEQIRENKQLDLYSVVKLSINKCKLNKKITHEILELFKNLGTMNIYGEVRNIQGIRKDLEQLEKEFVEYRNKYLKIYNYGGGLLGTTLVLLLL